MLPGIWQLSWWFKEAVLHLKVTGLHPVRVLVHA